MISSNSPTRRYIHSTSTYVTLPTPLHLYGTQADLKATTRHSSSPKTKAPCVPLPNTLPGNHLRSFKSLQQLSLNDNWWRFQGISVHEQWERIFYGLTCQIIILLSFYSGIRPLTFHYQWCLPEKKYSDFQKIKYGPNIRNVHKW